MPNFENPDRSLNKDEVEKELDEARKEMGELQAKAENGEEVDQQKIKEIRNKIDNLNRLLGSDL
ncbi:MAG: hypothetical protein Q8O87_02245 [bacterium]|nr:hypothetical protein [bacterium]